MSSILKYRLLLLWNAIQGPSIGHARPEEVEIKSVSILGSNRTETIHLSSMNEWTTIGDPTYFPIQILAERDSLKLQIPVSAHLQNANWVGWETLWNGKVSKVHAKGGLEISIPFEGWWKITTPAASIHLFYRRQNFSFSFRLKNDLSSLLASLRSQTSSMIVLATFLHISLYAFLVGAGSIRAGYQKKADSSPKTLTEFTVDSGSFNGRSLFAIPDQNTEEPHPGGQPPVNQMVSSIKKLSVQLQRQRKLKGLQGKQVQPNFSDTEVTAPSKIRTVHWTPQFNLDTNNKALSPRTESQHQALIKEFHKYQDHFRTCYESALQSFDEMAVTASYEGEVNNRGRLDRHKFNISGRTTPDAEENLVNCLKTVMSKIKFDETLSGTHIRNQFVFKL